MATGTPRGTKRSTCSLTPSGVVTVSSELGAGMVIIARRSILGPRPSDGHMRITEIYASIQGETQYAGLPCTLVRTTGCDLRCTYCDSAFAFYGGSDMTVDEIIAAVRELGAPLILLTGGEPMLQREIAGLAERLLEAGYRVMIETSGAHSVDSLPAEVVRIIDVKTPGSGESARVRWEVLDGLRRQDAVKFVVADETDYRWAADVVIRAGVSRSAPRCCCRPSTARSIRSSWWRGCCATGWPPG